MNENNFFSCEISIYPLGQDLFIPYLIIRTTIYYCGAPNDVKTVFYSKIHDRLFKHIFLCHLSNLAGFFL